MSEMVIDVEKQCSVILKSVSNLPSTTFSSERKSEIIEIIENIQSKLAKIEKSIFVKTTRGRQLISQIKENASSIVKILDELPKDPSLKPRLDSQLNELKLVVESMDREIRRHTIVVT